MSVPPPFMPTLSSIQNELVAAIKHRKEAALWFKSAAICLILLSWGADLTASLAFGHSQTKNILTITTFGVAAGCVALFSFIVSWRNKSAEAVAVAELTRTLAAPIEALANQILVQLAPLAPAATMRVGLPESNPAHKQIHATAATLVINAVTGQLQ